MGDASQATAKRVDHPGESLEHHPLLRHGAGLIAGLYSRDQVAIDLRRLAEEAGVAFVQAEIQSLDLTSQTLQLEGRLPLPFTQLSLDVGAISRPIAADRSPPAGSLVPIKPLEPALALLESQNGNL